MQCKREDVTRYSRSTRTCLVLVGANEISEHGQKFVQCLLTLPSNLKITRIVGKKHSYCEMIYTK